MITPYSGWSKGIYYNQRSDALGDNEQALVIADIDPLFMQEGKPRPQALANPLQLVAYLPIVELNGDKALDFSSRINACMGQLKPPNMTGRIVNPTSGGVKEIKDLLSQQLENIMGKPFDARFDHWEKYWRANPVAGIPPALIDWLWIDTTVADSDVTTVKIFVPTCS